MMLRFGTAEVTRLGMKTPEMEQVADLVAACIGGEDQQRVAREAAELASRFQQVGFSFDLAGHPTLASLVRTCMAT